MLRDLGEHRLKDLTRPERVFQLDAAGLPTTFPPLRSLGDALRHNLPEQLTSFVGRERELVEVSKLIGLSRLVTHFASASRRPVLVVGPSGMTGV